jgi:hypothetical protein
MEGRNIQIDSRFAAADPTRIRASVAELMALSPLRGSARAASGHAAAPPPRSVMNWRRLILPPGVRPRCQMGADHIVSRRGVTLITPRGDQLRFATDRQAERA